MIKFNVRGPVPLSFLRQYFYQGPSHCWPSVLVVEKATVELSAYKTYVVTLHLKRSVYFLDKAKSLVSSLYRLRWHLD